MKKDDLSYAQSPPNKIKMTIGKGPLLPPYIIKVLKVLLGVERKKIIFDTEKVCSLTCMDKKSSELNYSLSFFSLLQVEHVFFTSFH